MALIDASVPLLTMRTISIDGTSSITSTADRKSTRLNSSHSQISYAVFCLKKKKIRHIHNMFMWRLFVFSPLSPLGCIRIQYTQFTTSTLEVHNLQRLDDPLEEPLRHHLTV